MENNNEIKNVEYSVREITNKGNKIYSFLWLLALTIISIVLTPKIAIYLYELYIYNAYGLEVVIALFAFVFTAVFAFCGCITIFYLVLKTLIDTCKKITSIKNKSEENDECIKNK